MFLIQRSTQHMVEVLSVQDLFDPFRDHIVGRYNFGEDLPDAEKFLKNDLEFLSGEPLPQCWIDPHYRNPEHRSTGTGG